MKKTLEKSKNVLQEKRKKLKRKISIKKTNTFTKIVMNFVQEQLIEVKTPHERRKHKRESEFLFKHRFLTLLE